MSVQSLSSPAPFSSASSVEVSLTLGVDQQSGTLHKISSTLGFFPVTTDKSSPALHFLIPDKGSPETGALARRLHRIKGVKRVTAERRCPHRGLIYRIRLY